MKLSSSLEEYLKTIYIIENTRKRVRVTDIAKKLGYTKPSVNRALNTLKSEELIHYKVYGNIELTKKGIEIAKSIIKRYDTLKIFLTEVLEVDKDIAKKEATSMKHSISEDTVIKLETYINKILDLGDLDCDYDENSEKCKTCVKVTAKSRLNSDIN